MTTNIDHYIAAARPVVARYGKYPSRGSREHAAFKLDIADALHGAGFPECPAGLVGVYFREQKMCNEGKTPDDDNGYEAAFAVGMAAMDQALARPAENTADILAKLVVLAYELREMSMGGAVYDGVITSIRGVRRLSVCR